MKTAKKIVRLVVESIFPLSYMVKEKNTNTLVLTILLYAAVILVYFLASALLGLLLGDIIAWLLGLFGTVVGLYSTVGIVLSLLCYWGITK